MLLVTSVVPVGGHINMYLSNRKQKLMPAYKELKRVGFTLTQTGGKFNAVQGDYISKP